MLKLQRPPVTWPGGYATAADFCRIFKGEMKRLYLLAFLLTANHVKAESCFLAAFADAGKTAGVFREFASSWSRRAIIAHAIRLMTPVSSHASETSDLWEEGVQTILGAPDPLAGNIKNTEGKDEKANEDEQAHAQFRPRQLFTARHSENPPKKKEANPFKTLYRIKLETVVDTNP